MKSFVSKPLGTLFPLASALVFAVAGCAHTEPDRSAHTSEAAKPTQAAPRETVAFETPPSVSTPATATHAPLSADEELKKLMEADDLAQGEVDGWILENNKFLNEGAGTPGPEMRQRILKRFQPVRAAYEDFIARYPDHVEARVAFASFLGDLGEEYAAAEHLEKARELDPKDPAVWNNLANFYGHNGPTTNAFAYYEKAIELDSTEPVYYHNFATTVYLFRRDAMDFYKIPEAQVFDKALDLYAKALRLDPTNFPLATDLATSYYLIKPLRTNDALQSWTNALAIAHDDVERQGVYLHMARIKMSAGMFDEARAHLEAVKEPIYEKLKERLTRNLNEKEGIAKGIIKPPPEDEPDTNAPSAEPAPEPHAHPHPH